MDVANDKVFVKNKSGEIYITHPCAHEQQVHCVTDGFKKKSYHLPERLAVEGHAQRSA